jgi:ribosome-associated protein
VADGPDAVADGATDEDLLDDDLLEGDPLLDGTAAEPGDTDPTGR